MTTSAEKSHSWRADILMGAYLTLPMMIVFSTVGMTFAVLATQAGLPAWGILPMSFPVFAGAAQLAALAPDKPRTSVEEPVHWYGADKLTLSCPNAIRWRISPPL